MSETQAPYGSDGGPGERMRYLCELNAAIDWLARAPLSGDEQRCALYLVRQTLMWNRAAHAIPISAWAEGTGILPSHVSRCLKVLEACGICACDRRSTHTTVYRVLPVAGWSASTKVGRSAPTQGGRSERRTSTAGGTSTSTSAGRSTSTKVGTPPYKENLKEESKETSAPTERDAPAAPPVPARGEQAEVSAETTSSTPSKPKRYTDRKAGADASEREQGARRAPRPPTNAIQRVEQGIKAAGLRPVVNFGRDGKQLADLLAANPEVTAEDVIACYVAIATGKYGDDFMRQHLTIAFVCARGINGYLNWRLTGGKAGGVGRVSGNARPARSTSVSNWDEFDYEGWEREQRARLAPAGDEAG